MRHVKRNVLRSLPWRIKMLEIHCVTIVRTWGVVWVTVAAEMVPAADSSLTVVAPTLITDRARAEARVAIRNPTTTAQTFQLELYVDSPLGRQSLASTSVHVPAQGQSLQSSWFSTTGLAGANVVRYRVTGSDSVDMGGESPLSVAASSSRAVPLITAAWLDPGAILPGVYSQQRSMTAQDVRNELDAAHAVGIDTLIVTYPEYVLNGWGSFYPSQHFNNSASFDVVGTILNQASKNGQRVIVGLGRGNDLYLTWNGFDDAQRNAAALAHDSLVANELWNLYRDEPSFYGWNLTHEANDLARASQSYYNAAVDMLRNIEADKPVMISPAGTPIVSGPILDASRVDIFAYQDAVGAGYVPYVNTFDPQQRIATLNGVYASYAAAHANANKHLWTNLENWQMDGPAYSNAYSATIERVLKQLEIEKNYVDAISSYEWFGFAEHPASTVRMGGSRAVSLYNGYRDYYRQTKAALKTVNYAVNSGFEAGTLTDGAAPEGWTFGGNGTTQRVSYSDDTPTNTVAALRLDVQENAGLPWLVQDIAVLPGQEYQFSAWVKRLAGDPAGGALSAQVWMLENASSPTILHSAALQFSSATWEYNASLISAPATATVARIVLVAQDNAFGIGTGSYLIDGVALVGAEIVRPGDFDKSGVTDGADLLRWQRGFPFTYDATDLATWQANDGPGAEYAANAAPEPAMSWLAILAGVREACHRRRCSKEGP